MFQITIVNGKVALNESLVGQVLPVVEEVTKELCGNYEFGMKPSVHLYFYAPGAPRCPKNDYMTEGDLSLETLTQEFHVAITDDHDVLTDSDDPYDYIAEAFGFATTNAFHTFDDEDIDFPLREVDALAEQIVELAEERLAF